jgi:dTDP-glucose pyrophosphorylase
MKRERKKYINQRKIDTGASIRDAMKKMDEIDQKLLLVFEGEHFRSLLSIGDIQRAIISNRSLDTKVKEVVRKKIKVASTEDDYETVRQMMITYRTECMPVLDKDGELYDVIFWADIFKKGEKRIVRKLNLPVVIMAGGAGTRLKPLTNVIPKPLIPIDDKTIMEHILDRFVSIGCNRFLASVNFKSEFIRFYFDNLKNPDYNIIYLREDKPLGTAGSLFMLKGKIKTTFFVSNCDILIDQDYGEIYDYHMEQKNELTIVAALKHVRIPYGTVETAEGGQLTKLVEKPEITYKINSGLYILEPHLLDEIPENKFYNITDLIDKILERKGKVGVFPVTEKSWTDIGEWSEYLKITNKYWNPVM